MKKIIVAIDGLKFSQSATDYAIQLARQMNAHLVGIFLDDFTYHSYKIYELVQSKGGVSEEKLQQFENQDTETRMLATESFKAACQEAGLNYSIHHDRNIALPELLHESLYADLLVIDSKETLTHYEENLPTRFIRELLVKSECPVLVVPRLFKAIEKIVLLYDGGPSSIHAIKLFGYLFPLSEQLKVEVVAVKAPHHDMHLPDNRLMKEFMKRHFPDAEYTILQGLPDIEIINHLKHKNQHELIVLGAYGRNNISRWLRSSIADELMRELRSPLFITHK